MANLNNESRNYESLIADIKKGQLKIPQFQRKFVWDLKQSAGLIDSMLKGYPIGTLIFWRTKERLRSIRNLGNINFPEPNEGEFVDYVLDGQQRLTSIYAVLKGVEIVREGERKVDYSHIYIDLESDKEEDAILITDITERREYTYIKIVDLLKGGIGDLSKYPEKYHKKLDDYKNSLNNYSFSVVSLKEASIDVATEVFTRLNVGGKELTLFEIMVAKTYDEKKGFDLAEKYDALIEEFQDCNYDTISPATVLQVVSILLKKECTRTQILKLPKNDVIEIWDEAIDGIRSTIDYFRSFYNIPVSKMLPYNALIVPFSYYFYKEKKKPMGDIQRKMTDMFWRISLGNRYSSGVESKIVQDIERIDTILKGENPKYEWSIVVEPQDIINNGWFGTGRSFIKAILSIMASKKPKSFDDNADVTIDNSNLKTAASKNYHHFFPKAYMKKQQKEIDFWLVNNIVNITIVDDYLNKRKIKDKPPSKYMEEFSERNEKIVETMKTHLIGELDSFGILRDDFQTFLNKRAELISKEIKERLIDYTLSGPVHYEEVTEDDSDES